MIQQTIKEEPAFEAFGAKVPASMLSSWEFWLFIVFVAIVFLVWVDRRNGK